LQKQVEREYRSRERKDEDQPAWDCHLPKLHLGRKAVIDICQQGGGGHGPSLCQMPFSAAHGAYTHNEEPSLEQLLNEPIIRLLMARDRVEVETLRALLIAASAHVRLDEHPFNSHLRHGGELMRKRRAWVMPDEDARSLLQQIEERIRASDIEVKHRDVLIRLRSLIEEDLGSASQPRLGPQPSPGPDPQP
jgi:hypothetical protein